MAKNAAIRKDAGKRKPTGGAANRGTKKGQGALKAGNALKKSNASSKAGRTAPGGAKRVKDGSGVHFRSESTIRRVQMYKTKGELSTERDGPKRIQPDRRWFGNTRVIAQDKMQAFRETISKGVADPFSVVLRSSKLPMSLLRDTEGKASRMKLLDVEPYNEVFGGGRRQKRPKIGCSDLDALLERADKKAADYVEAKDKCIKIEDGLISAGYDPKVEEVGAHHSEEIFLKGTSKRIWAELYKVVDASDVIVFVIDARDPMGTRNLKLEQEIKKNHPGKHIILLLNKVDLVPTWVSRRWIQVLMKEFPTLGMHASITNPFGKNALLNLLRQFGNLLKQAKHVTIGMIGYPNVGKSSVINTMKKKKVCKAAPVPGETKVWQYIALTKKIYLLDSPGIVPLTEGDFAADCSKVLKGVVRAERIDTPSDYIQEVLTRVKKQYLLTKYKLPAETTWEGSEEFLTILATKMGKLHKGGDADIETAARVVLYDWQRGRIPFFVPPPFEEGDPRAPASSSSSAPAAPDNKDKGYLTRFPPVVVDGETPAASSTDTAAAKDKAEDAEGSEEEDDADDDDDAEAKSGRAAGDGPRVQQSMASFDEVACALGFDEEDMRGQVAVPAAGSASTSTAAGSQQKRKARGEKLSADDAKAENKKKSLKRRSKKASAASGSRSTYKVQQGTVDWKAVTAEFDM